MKEFLMLYRVTGRVTPFGSRPSRNPHQIHAVASLTFTEDMTAEQARQLFVMHSHMFTLEVVVEHAIELCMN